MLLFCQQFLADFGVRLQYVRPKTFLVIAKAFVWQRFGDRFSDVGLAPHFLATVRLFFCETLLGSQKSVAD